MRSLVPLQGFSEQAVVDSIQETSKGTPSPNSGSDRGFELAVITCFAIVSYLA